MLGMVGEPLEAGFGVHVVCGKGVSVWHASLTVLFHSTSKPGCKCWAVSVQGAAWEDGVVVVSLLALAAYSAARVCTTQCGWLQLHGSLLLGAQHHVGVNSTNHCRQLRVCVWLLLLSLCCPVAVQNLVVYCCHNCAANMCSAACHELHQQKKCEVSPVTRVSMCRESRAGGCCARRCASAGCIAS